MTNAATNEAPLSGFKKFRTNLKRFIDYVDHPPHE